MHILIHVYSYIHIHSLKTINFRVILGDPPIGFKCHFIYCGSTVRSAARNQQTRTEFNNRIFSHNISDGINSNGRYF